MKRSPHLAPALALAALAVAASAGEVVLGAPAGYPVADKDSLLLVSAVGDIDNDGDPDAVVGGFSPHPPVQALLNAGDGTFGPAVPVATGDPHRIALADMDEDGNLDLLTANGTLRMRYGEGDGTFTGNQFLFSNSDTTRFFDVFDVNGDDHLDVIALNGTVLLGGGFVWVLPGNGDGTFGTPYAVDAFAATEPRTVDVGDVDGDGVTDMVVTAATLNDGSALLYLGTGSGQFDDPLVLGTGQGPADARLRDYDGDGWLDIIVASAAGLGVRKGHGDGTFGSTVVVTTEAVNARLAVADLDGDGDLDVAANHGGLHETVVYANDGAGAFSESARITGMPTSDDLRPADYDGDGRVDLARVLTSLDPEWQVLLNHTYGPGEPWTDLGLALSETESGLARRPVLWVEGDLTPGSPLAFVIERNDVAPPNTFLVLGLSSVFAPFKGGTLVPAPDVLVGPLPVLPVLPLGTTFPTDVPSGVSFWLQVWCAPNAPATQFAATTAVTGVTP